MHSINGSSIKKDNAIYHLFYTLKVYNFKKFNDTTGQNPQT